MAQGVAGSVVISVEPVQRRAAYYGWTCVAAAALAMVATLPGRTVGLGLVTMMAIPGLEAAVRSFGWRAAWGGMGVVLACAVAPLLWAVVRSSPESAGVPMDGTNDGPDDAAHAPPAGSTLRQALATPEFWGLALGGFVFNAAYSGITLFNESILAERGFGASPAGPLVVIVFTALAANFLAGWLAT